MKIRVKRVYEPPSAADGFRVLVDRLWPRGVSKAAAKVDLWLKDVAPSDALRKSFGHEPERWPAFRRDYKRELAGKKEPVAQLRRLAREHGTLTLLFGAKDKERNNARVLAEVL